jgi:hypothetical protein
LQADPGDGSACFVLAYANLSELFAQRARTAHRGAAELVERLH